jgi:hypothetical protein
MCHFHDFFRQFTATPRSVRCYTPSVRCYTPSVRCYTPSVRCYIPFSLLLYPVQFAAIPRSVCCYTLFSLLLYPVSLLLYPVQFAAIPHQVCCYTTSSSLLYPVVWEPHSLLLRGASPTLYHVTCPLPSWGWGCRMVNGLSTVTHPPPQYLLSRGRHHTQAGWDHTVASLPLPPPS